jgi:hypothetical protein
MPEVTKTLAVLGFNGLTIVLANSKDITPEREKNIPIIMKTITSAIFSVIVNKMVSVKLLNHPMPAAMNIATKGGGISFSKNFMMCLIF